VCAPPTSGYETNRNTDASRACSVNVCTMLPAGVMRCDAMCEPDSRSNWVGTGPMLAANFPLYLRAEGDSAGAKESQLKP
jgi:hypothetical protein